MNLIDKIIAYKTGKLDSKNILALLTELVRAKRAWTLQGAYHLIETKGLKLTKQSNNENKTVLSKRPSKAVRKYLGNRAWTHI